MILIILISSYFWISGYYFQELRFLHSKKIEKTGEKELSILIIFGISFLWVPIYMVSVVRNFFPNFYENCIDEIVSIYDKIELWIMERTIGSNAHPKVDGNSKNKNP